MIGARRWFYLTVAAQGIFLAAWAGWNEAALRRSPTVLLETRPVDPFEIIRGDYITMNYVIATVPKERVKGLFDAIDQGETLCVRLVPSGEFWEAIEATIGRCACAGDLPLGHHEIEGTRNYGREDALRIDYGIGRFYVPEGKGTPQGKLTARVAVTPWCRAMIKEVYLDGETYP